MCLTQCHWLPSLHPKQPQSSRRSFETSPDFPGLWIASSWSVSHQLPAEPSTLRAGLSLARVGSSSIANAIFLAARKASKCAAVFSDRLKCVFPKNVRRSRSTCTRYRQTAPLRHNLGDLSCDIAVLQLAGCIRVRFEELYPVPRTLLCDSCVLQLGGNDRHAVVL